MKLSLKTRVYKKYDLINVSWLHLILTEQPTKLFLTLNLLLFNVGLRPTLTSYGLSFGKIFS
jgi:hypothetical protein